MNLFFAYAFVKMSYQHFAAILSLLILKLALIPLSPDALHKATREFRASHERLSCTKILKDITYFAKY